MPSSGHVAVASASGGFVNHKGPHSELRTNFPLSCLFEVLLQLSPHRPRAGWDSVQILFGNQARNNSKGRRSLTLADIEYTRYASENAEYSLARFWRRKGKTERNFIKKSTGICLKTLHGKDHCFFGWALVLNLFAVTFTVKSLPDYLHYLKKS